MDIVEPQDLNTLNVSRKKAELFRKHLLCACQPTWHQGRRRPLLLPRGKRGNWDPRGHASCSRSHGCTRQSLGLKPPTGRELTPQSGRDETWKLGVGDCPLGWGTPAPPLS